MYILSMLLFGTNGYLVAHISLQSSQIVLVRTLIGGLVLSAMVLLQKDFSFSRIKPELGNLLAGGIALGLNWVTLFAAYRMLNVSLATLIYYAGPMLVLLFSPWLFREKLTKQKLPPAWNQPRRNRCRYGSGRRKSSLDIDSQWFPKSGGLPSGRCRRVCHKA